MSPKPAERVSTTTNSATAISSSTSISTSQKSSLLKSAFSPSKYQLRLFASVIQSFDSQRLRIHDTSTGRLRCQHAVEAAAKINCLTWGSHRPRDPSSQQSSSRKRKQPQQTEDVVVAYGTNKSEICLLSPTEGKVVGTLTGGHERGVQDFRFSDHEPGSAWSLGGDVTLVQWDLGTSQVIRTISLTDTSTSALAQLSPPNSLLCASSTPTLITAETRDRVQIQPFDSMKNRIHTLFHSGTPDPSLPGFFLAADGDRYINIYNLAAKRLARTLIASSGVDAADLLVQNGDQEDLKLNQQILATTNKDGSVDLFPRPFVPPLTRNGDLKSSRKNLTQKPTARILLVSSSDKSPHPIFAASLQGAEIVIASIDGGVDVSFQRVRWQDEGTGELLLDGVKEVIRNKSTSALSAAPLNGVKDMGKSHVDESTAVVVNGQKGVSEDAAIAIESSDEDNADEEETSSGEDESEKEGGAAVEDQDDESASDAESDEEMQDAPAPADDAGPETIEEPAEPSEPTFADLLASRHPTTIPIANIADGQNTVLANVDNGQLSLSSGMSLSTVLSQSLRTNDQSLLESCLHASDPSTIRNTIQRLDSNLAGVLITRLAERISSRPGRYGHLQTWVQEVCVAHGAGIARQPVTQGQLKLLFRVLNERAKNLSHLLVLKGKLDMLDAQLSYRRELAAQRRSIADSQGGPVIHVVGEEDNWESEEDLDSEVGSGPKQKAKHRKTLDHFMGEDVSSNGEDVDEEGEDENMPATLPNGIDGDESSENEERSDEDEDEDEGSDLDVTQQPGALVDDEAEVEGDEASESEEDGTAGSDESGSEDKADEEEEEEDSSMADFINDGSIDLESGAETDIDMQEDEPPKKPPTKRSKH